MTKKSWVQIVIFILVSFQIVDIQAQTIQKKYSIRWGEPFRYTFSDGSQQSFLTFENATYGYDFPDLPVFYEAIPVDIFFSDYNVKVVSQEFEEMTAQETALVPQDFHNQSVKYEISSAYDRHDVFARLYFIPIMETASGRYQKLTSVTLEITGMNAKARKGTRGYAAQSVLAKGQWYQFSLTETGIYKVTYQDLTAMGMSSPITSSQLAVFGNGGMMLSERNDDPRVDDLSELPLEMHDGGDGSFDNGDYFLFYGLSPHRVRYDAANQQFTHDYNIYSDNSISRNDFFVIPMTLCIAEYFSSSCILADKCLRIYIWV